MQRERFGTWLIKAFQTLIGSKGILFLINLLSVFFSWVFFVMMIYINKLPHVDGLDILYTKTMELTYGSFLLFVVLVLCSTWTYWDAYVRLTPNRNAQFGGSDVRTPKSPMKSMVKPQGKLQIPNVLKPKKPLFTSTHNDQEEKPVEEEIQKKTTTTLEKTVVVETQPKKRGRPKGSKNTVKTPEA